MADIPMLAAIAGDYGERPPLPGLRPGVRCLWRNRLRPGAGPLLVVPDGNIDLVWTGEELRVAGPDSGPVLEAVPAGAGILGVRLRPGTAAAWLGVPASAIADARLPLAAFWGRAAEPMAERLATAPDDWRRLALLQALLLSRRPGALPDGQGAPAILRALARPSGSGEGRIARIATELGLTERTLRRRCEALFGLGPKTLDRILRFQRALCRLRSGPVALADLAGLCGYADQAHLTREARRLSGLTPAELARQLAGAGQKAALCS
jgi:AraC-like DNA-binding protein